MRCDTFPEHAHHRSIAGVATTSKTYPVESREARLVSLARDVGTHLLQPLSGRLDILEQSFQRQQYLSPEDTKALQHSADRSRAFVQNVTVIVDEATSSGESIDGGAIKLAMSTWELANHVCDRIQLLLDAAKSTVTSVRSKERASVFSLWSLSPSPAAEFAKLRHSATPRGGSASQATATTSTTVAPPRIARAPPMVSTPVPMLKDIQLHRSPNSNSLSSPPPRSPKKSPNLSRYSPLRSPNGSVNDAAKSVNTSLRSDDTFRSEALSLAERRELLEFIDVIAKAAAPLTEGDICRVKASFDALYGANGEGHRRFTRWFDDLAARAMRHPEQRQPASVSYHL